MAHQTLLERLEEAERMRDFAEALACSRSNALLLSDRRVVELERANKDLRAKLEKAEKRPVPELIPGTRAALDKLTIRRKAGRDALDRQMDEAVHAIYETYGPRLDLFFADVKRLRAESEGER